MTKDQPERNDPHLQTTALVLLKATEAMANTPDTHARDALEAAPDTQGDPPPDSHSIAVGTPPDVSDRPNLMNSKHYADDSDRLSVSSTDSSSRSLPDDSGSGLETPVQSSSIRAPKGDSDIDVLLSSIASWHIGSPASATTNTPSTPSPSPRRRHSTADVDVTFGRIFSAAKADQDELRNRVDGIETELSDIRDTVCETLRISSNLLMRTQEFLKRERQHMRRRCDSVANSIRVLETMLSDAQDDTATLRAKYRADQGRIERMTNDIATLRDRQEDLGNRLERTQGYERHLCVLADRLREILEDDQAPGAPDDTRAPHTPLARSEQFREGEHLLEDPAVEKLSFARIVDIALVLMCAQQLIVVITALRSCWERFKHSLFKSSAFQFSTQFHAVRFICGRWLVSMVPSNYLYAMAVGLTLALIIPLIHVLHRFMEIPGFLRWRRTSTVESADDSPIWDSLRF
ncbi:hypothetical protein NUW54_g2560 [Trametes sanguinea]|uniref:Uncharacterized protein n=2 Tax=Trametes sanguinea TaxID=158606 RepID=A0ACC1PVH8_9APHY|nr:hypothetical protein NUW54_g6467 [Trametes sanguinea]KAJ3010194.1 hypothetical protein NUW54_g2560 [Trametes sanguinea]